MMDDDNTTLRMPPTVVLDTDAVSHHMAARLCISFLGHVLFLKNQVPFPVVQLAKMPTSENARAAKKRQELLNSFDTLASHLYTTFIALSTALALKGSPAHETDTALPHARDGMDRAFFAVAFGPTVGTAKSRVIVGIDKLETRVWGRPNGAVPTDDGSEDSDDDSDEEAKESEESSSEQEDASGSDEDTSPPLSRSPSPTLSSDANTDADPSPSVLSNARLGRSEDPEAIRAAERLLSRMLASACAEDDGQGLASEMAPTHIHVLLRAPRRFDHPCWVPRQNLCPSLDNYLADFLVESGERPASKDSNHKKRTKTSKMQGLWIKSNGDTRVEECEEALAEEDELIWWSWDGKLVGFADW